MSHYGESNTRFTALHAVNDKLLIGKSNMSGDTFINSDLLAIDKNFDNNSLFNLNHSLTDIIYNGEYCYLIGNDSEENYIGSPYVTKIEISDNTLFNSSLGRWFDLYYPFDGNANDESGNENNGIVNGANYQMIDLKMKIVHFH